MVRISSNKLIVYLPFQCDFLVSSVYPGAFYVTVIRIVMTKAMKLKIVLNAPSFDATMGFVCCLRTFAMV